MSHLLSLEPKEAWCPLSNFKLRRYPDAVAKKWPALRRATEFPERRGKDAGIRRVTLSISDTTRRRSLASRSPGSRRISPPYVAAGGIVGARGVAEERVDATGGIIDTRGVVVERVVAAGGIVDARAISASISSKSSSPYPIVSTMVTRRCAMALSLRISNRPCRHRCATSSRDRNPSTGLR